MGWSGISTENASAGMPLACIRNRKTTCRYRRDRRRHLAERAADDPGAEWRIIVTTPDGAALAVTRIPRPRARDGPQ